MSFEEEFDGIIRRKAEEENYPFDQGNWEKASGLLDADKKALRAEKLRRILLPGTLLLLLGTAGFVVFNYVTNEDSDKGISVVTGSKPAGSDVTSLNERDLSLEKNSATESTSKTELENVNTAPMAKHDATTPGPEPETAASGKLVAATVVVAKVSDVKQLYGPAVENTKPENSEKSLENSSTNVAEKKVAEPATENSAVENAAKGNNSFTREESSNPVTSGNSSISENGDQQNQKKSETQPEEIALNATQESIVNAEQLDMVYATLPTEAIEMNLMPTPFSFLPRYDDDYYNNGKKPKKHYFNIEGGANYLLGWAAAKGKDGQGLNWYGGFNYGLYLCRKTSISVGLQAYNISHINQPFYRVSGKEYGFGSTPVYTTVTSNQLYYIALPLKLNYAVNSANTIGFGVNGAYLLSAENTVYNYYFLDNAETSAGPGKVRTKGVYEGTSMANFMLTAHYSTRFGKRIGVNFEVNYGLTDLFKNTSDIKTAEKPLAVRVGLTYTIFDK